IGRSQQGNNNAYCQDNEISWIDWTAISDRDEAFFNYVAGVVRIRRRWPQLRSSRFMHGNRPRRDDLKDVSWLRPDGRDMRPADWENGFSQTVGMMLAAAGEPPLFIAISAHHEPVDMRMPSPRRLETWQCIADSARGVIQPPDRPLPAGADLRLPERAILVFEGRLK
ncbi:MAG: hypothetical protein KKB37_14230, partial [Alphaproteobacteria bacterium]|nr:hypothetical protein [Alphaproteobacteria bacterium]